MGGVNLVEESQRILATNSDLVGTQIRSCKDESHFLSSALHRRLLSIGKLRLYNSKAPKKQLLKQVFSPLLFITQFFFSKNLWSLVFSFCFQIKFLKSCFLFSAESILCLTILLKQLWCTAAKKRKKNNLPSRFGNIITFLSPIALILAAVGSWTPPLEFLKIHLVVEPVCNMKMSMRKCTLCSFASSILLFPPPLCNLLN